MHRCLREPRRAPTQPPDITATIHIGSGQPDPVVSCQLQSCWQLAFVYWSQTTETCSFRTCALLAATSTSDPCPGRAQVRDGARGADAFACDVRMVCRVLRTSCAVTGALCLGSSRTPTRKQSRRCCRRGCRASAAPVPSPTLPRAGGQSLATPPPADPSCASSALPQVRPLPADLPWHAHAQARARGHHA